MEVTSSKQEAHLRLENRGKNTFGKNSGSSSLKLSSKSNKFAFASFSNRICFACVFLQIQKLLKLFLIEFFPPGTRAREKLKIPKCSFFRFAVTNFPSYFMLADFCREPATVENYEQWILRKLSLWKIIFQRKESIREFSFRSSYLAFLCPATSTILYFEPWWVKLYSMMPLVGVRA